MTRAHFSPRKPRVGITLGDPAGIGPEIALKSVLSEDVRAVCSPVLVGDAFEFKRQATLLGLPGDYPVATFDNEVADGSVYPVIVDTGRIDAPCDWGNLSAAAGRAAITSIENATRLCLAGHLDAIATAPINKQAITLAGSPFPGHTEMLASLCRATDWLMCFTAGNFRVILLTIHVSLREAIALITKDRVINAIKLAASELKRFGNPHPRIAVAGLNPHAGEHGLFGFEDETELRPAVDHCRAECAIDVHGPLPADTLFVKASRGEFDAVMACYHDQGLVAVKCLAFGRAVGLTLGLPIIRTSVDHGTAFDIAGNGVADQGSMVEAIKLAAALVELQGLRNTQCSSEVK